MILDVVCCYLWLFSLYIHVNIIIGKIVVKCWSSRWPPVWDIAVHLAVACDVYDCVFPRVVLDEILDLIESVSEGFPTYS